MHGIEPFVPCNESGINMVCLAARGENGAVTYCNHPAWN